jgi:hypothetical protein
MDVVPANLACIESTRNAVHAKLAWMASMHTIGITSKGMKWTKRG